MIQRKIQNKNTWWFTLVELIIVITILAVLATIAFLSFQGYWKNSRDTNRLSTLNQIEKGLQWYKIQTWEYPLPDNYITLSSNGDVLWYQWFAWKQVLELLKIWNGGVDPLDNSYYTYSVNVQRNLHQEVWFLEKNDWYAFVSKGYAESTDYSQRYPKTFWDSLWVLLWNTWSYKNLPIQLLKSEVSFTWIDIGIFTGTLSNGVNVWWLSWYLWDGTTIHGTGNILVNLETNYFWEMNVISTKCAWWSEISKEYVIAGGPAMAQYDFIDLSFTWITLSICDIKKWNFELWKNINVLMPVCSPWWSLSDKYSISWWPWAAICGNATDGFTSCKICVPDAWTVSFHSWDEVVMPSCPTGWSVSPINITWSWPGSIGCKRNESWSTLSCKICRKN